MPISLLAAFLGGVISLFSPCSALVLPSFFASSFHQGKKLVLATAIFSLGILSVMLPLGLGLLAVIRFLSSYRQLITLIIGIVLIIEGALQLIGKSFFMPSYQGESKIKNSRLSSVYYLGLASGVGTMSCVGPILGAIITLAANSVNVINAVILILTYTLGLIGPLFLLSFLWQKNQTKAAAILRGRTITIHNLKIHTINIAAGLLFLFLGYIFIRYQGSLGLLPFFSHSQILNFTFDLQDKLFTL